MNTNRKMAVIVGGLYLLSYVGVFAGGALLEPLLSAPDYLIIMDPNRFQVVTGVLLELMNGLAVVGIAVLLFPLLKPYGEGIAIGYVAMRLLEAAMQIAMDLSPLSLLALGRQFTEAGAPAGSGYMAAGALLLTERRSASLMLGIFFCLGAGLFYVLLHRSRLVPRYLSVWGLVGVAGIALIQALDLFQIGFNMAMVLALPIIGNELFLGAWLIVKGFDPAPLALRPASSPAAAA